jgi:hypothetical protein
LGRWDGHRLLYAGKARSGYTDAVLRDLRERLDPYIRTTSPRSVPIQKPNVRLKGSYASPTQVKVRRARLHRLASPTHQRRGADHHIDEREAQTLDFRSAKSRVATSRDSARRNRVLFLDGSQNPNSQSSTIVRVIPSVRLLRYCYPNSVEIDARISAC